MAIREIRYNVTPSGVTPASHLWGGVQNEDNATNVVYVFDSAYLATLGTLDNLRFRIDFNSASAGYEPSENLSISNSAIERAIPKRMTQNGGQITVMLVIARIVPDTPDATEVILQEPSTIFFTSASVNDGRFNKNLSAYEEYVGGLITKVADEVSKAESASESARESAISAGNQVTLAGEQVTLAKNEADRAENASVRAENAASNANTDANRAGTAAQSAVTSAFDARGYKVEANESATKAKEAQQKAEEASAKVTRENVLFSNALKGTASGEVIGMHDVSPIEHEMGVKVNFKLNILENCSITYTPRSTWGSNGLTTNQYTTNYTAVQPLIDVFENYTYMIPRFRGMVVLYDADGKNATQLDRTGIYGDFEFTVPAGKTKIGIAYLSDYTSTVDKVYCLTHTPVKVKKYGKNIIDYTKVEPRIAGQTVVINEENKSVVWSGNYFFKIPLGFTVKAGTEISFSCIASKFHRLGFANTSDSNNDVVSEDAVTSNGICIITQIAPIDFNMIYLYKRDATIFEENIVFEKIQLEIGNAPTEYNNYIQPTEYTPDESGIVSGVTSLYPSTTLMTDTDGAIIEATYNRDINKAFEELKNVILSLGGNV